jgi:hypothetical protein
MRRQSRKPVMPSETRYGFRRYELKYRIPRVERDAIREVILPHVRRDPYCEDQPKWRYTVRSIYFDTEDLQFYFEKLDSVKIRKKLRVRTYNRSADGTPAFLEIKRKHGRRGLKERLMLPIHEVDGALNGQDVSLLVGDRPFHDRVVMDRFRFNLRTKRLRPVVLVAYEREAFVGMDNDRLRVTFDSNLRSLIDPNMDDIFDESKLRQFEDRSFVLELKFDDFMPRWMARLVTLLNLRARPYSKYCYGIDAWAPHPR